jgi:hypothetical protein
MGSQVVHQDQGEAPAGARPRARGPHLGTKARGGAAGCQAPRTPAVTPVHKPAARDFGVGSRRLDQALSTATFAAPHAHASRMARALDRLLERESRPGQEGQQLVTIWRHFLTQVSLDQSRDGWRGWRASPSQDHLHPQAFPP